MRVDSGDFVLPVDKPAGPTSHDIVSLARKALDTRRVGHTGTLDPFASGLLVLCVGRATRLAEYLTGLDKTYRAEARLGVETDTLDHEGDVVAEDEGWSGLSEADIRQALASLVGSLQQIPPQYSAKKVEGEAMHRKARRGERVELPAASVTVHAIELEAMELPRIRFTVRCSSGTYVRALARDLGRRLEVGAHLTGLRRTRVGDLGLQQAISVESLDDERAVAEARLAALTALDHLASVTVDAAAARRIVHGQRVRLASAEELAADSRDAAGDPSRTDAHPVAVAHAGELLAVGEVHDGVLRPRKVFPA